MNGAFSGCNNLGTFTATDSPDLSNVTNMSFMFTSTWYFSADLDNWDTSHVTNMAYMFNDTNFNGDIGSWNTGSVTSMVGMFKYAIDFNQDISNWDTSKVTHMGEMFTGATAFNQDISGWNTSNVTNMNVMFNGATAFDQNLGAWNVAKVTIATNMFAGKALSTANYDALLIGWDAQTLKPNVTFHGGWSKYCTGEAARANMISSDGWTITDLGKDASCFTNTPVGSNVPVQPVDTTSGTAPVTLTFAQITQAGTTSLTTSSTGTPPPAGFQLGDPPVYYDLSTTALFEGPVELCIDYTSFSDESNLKLHHYENGAWVDRTISLDTQANIICASVTSLSPFAIFENVNINDAPVADNDSYSTNEDTALVEATVGPLGDGVLANDTDADNDSLTAVFDTDPSNGTLVLSSDGSFTYTPNADFCGADSFTYHANDGTVDSNIATVDIDVTCVDDALVASDDTATVTEDDPATTIDVLFNDTDVDGGPRSIASVTQPANGTVINNGTDLTYEPNASYCNDGSPTDDFTYALTPGGSTATVAVTVTCVDNPPTALDDNATVTEDDQATTIDVLVNDTDIDGGPISITSVTQPANGTVVNNGTDLTYQPNASYCNDGTPTDDFTYTLSPGGSTATVAVTVTCVDYPPTALDNNATVTEDDQVTTIDVLVNDTDVDGGPKSIASVTQPANGTDLTCLPDASYCNDGSPTDDFTYALTPGGSTATVAVTITCVDDAPVVTVDVKSQTVQYSDFIADVTISATDVDSASLSISNNAFSDLSVGNESCSPSGSGVVCTWKLSGQALVAQGTYTITFTVSDGNSSSSASTDIIANAEDATVTFGNGNPIAVPVSTPGGDSEPFSFYVNVQEASESGSNTAPGDVNLASVSVTLEPVGPGSPITAACATTGAVTQFDYGAVLEVKCDFSGVPVNAYVATATVSGGYYTGSGEDSLVVYDPSLGFTTGGGSFYWPGTNDRTTFGYTMKYNKKATKVQGNLVLIRHLPDGTIYRLKSNAIDGLALGEESAFGWASFSGKTTYKEPGWLEAEGNYTFTAYVEDHSEPGSSDRFWIEVRDKDGNVVAALSITPVAPANAETLQGGNIVVPRK